MHRILQERSNACASIKKVHFLPRHVPPLASSVPHPVEITNFRLAYFHVLSPNATKYTIKLDKKIPKSKTEAVVWR